MGSCRGISSYKSGKEGELLDYVNVRNIVGLKHDFRADLMNLFVDSTAQFD